MRRQYSSEAEADSSISEESEKYPTSSVQRIIRAHMTKWMGWCSRCCSVCALNTPWKGVACFAVLVALAFVAFTQRASWEFHNHVSGHSGTHKLAVPATISAQRSTPSDNVELPEDVRALDLAPRFVVHLDDPPHLRWVSLLEHFQSEMSVLNEYLGDYLSMLSLQTGGLSLLQKRLKKLISADASPSAAFIPFLGELESISKVANIPLIRVVLLQLLFEAGAHCTSIVARSRDRPSGSLIHGRTLDWDVQTLSRLTVEVEFRRDDKPVLLATTWPGYVGVLTGVRPFEVAVSVNFRQHDLSTSAAIEVAARGHQLPGLAVRQALQSATPVSYLQIRQHFETVPLAAPCYITISGHSAPDGVVLTRDLDGSVRPITLVLPDQSPAGSGMDQHADQDKRPAESHTESTRLEEVLVQTNTDHWETDIERDVMDSFKRRAFAEAFFQEDSKSYKLNDVSDMWRVLHQPPVLNPATVYIAIMDVANGRLETRRMPTEIRNGLS